MPITITALNIYPVKSCAGIPLPGALLDARGFAHDREWMIVQDDDEERGMFLTQRELPHLALIQPALSDDALMVIGINDRFHSWIRSAENSQATLPRVRSRTQH
jgi:uncharacterized protein YcbX